MLLQSCFVTRKSCYYALILDINWFSFTESDSCFSPFYTFFLVTLLFAFNDRLSASAHARQVCLFCACLEKKNIHTSFLHGSKNAMYMYTCNQGPYSSNNVVATFSYCHHFFVYTSMVIACVISTPFLFRSLRLRCSHCECITIHSNAHGNDWNL